MVLSSISLREERRVVGENDAKIAAEAERYVVQHLTNLSATNPITQQYGKFVSLSGEGHQRRAGFINPPPLCISRRANFEKGEVRCTIQITGRGPLKIETRMTPTPQWLDENPHVRLEKRGRVIKAVSSDMQVLPELAVYMQHPEFFSNLSSSQRLTLQKE